MRSFCLIHRKAGFVLSQVPGSPDTFNCLWMKSNARYQGKAVEAQSIHICVGIAHAHSIVQLPDMVTHQWLEEHGQYEGGTQQKAPDKPSTSMVMVPKTEEGLVGVRANGTFCIDAPVATLSEIRARLAPLGL